LKNLKDFIKLLEEYPLRQVPKAARFIVNQMAFESRQQAIKEIDKRMILRNKFVTGRTQFEQSPFSRDLSDIQAKMGALESISFMAKQETGFVIKPTRGRKVAIPTRSTRISKSIEKRKRTIYRKSRLGNVRKIKKGTNKQREIFILTQQMARERDKRPALLPYSQKPGIYLIRNVRKRKTGTFSFKLIQLYDTSKSQVIVKPHPWMRPTVEKIFKRQAKIVQTGWDRFMTMGIR
jgi:hypothetical protein